MASPAVEVVIDGCYHRPWRYAWSLMVSRIGHQRDRSVTRLLHIRRRKEKKRENTLPVLLATTGGLFVLRPAPEKMLSITSGSWKWTSSGLMRTIGPHHTTSQQVQCAGSMIDFMDCLIAGWNV